MKGKVLEKICIFLAASLILSRSLFVLAENKTGTVVAEDVNKEIYSVKLPVVEDNNTFGFFIDPQDLLYNTYAGSEKVHVEEGANLLFINRYDDGTFGLTSESDRLSIVNRGTVPIDVTVIVTLNNTDGINLLKSDDRNESDTCDMYLAYVDDEGTEIPLSGDKEIKWTVRLDKAPLDAYAYVYDEENGQYVFSHEMTDVSFDSYSFGLKGFCNKDADWTQILKNPSVSVTWNVEPVFSEKDDADDEGSGDEDPDDADPGDEEKEPEDPDDEPEDISGNDIPEGDVSGNDE